MAIAPKALLVGGPRDLPDRIVPIMPSGLEIKISHRGGYEHFRPTPRTEETPEGALPVYEWVDRTKVAE
ncbi:hypothetical protein HLB23_19870 [Nocardia uniformis]|uniref:Uncharacterized protein n=1 Tax=Nocardia uniformis TaxID=53432 RepID=A0A849C873_9NOCA|nr:DUF5988 family protein [Nocardia uniformis]NNH72087.1 hypothetical protein [Nocardia uniformis]